MPKAKRSLAEHCRRKVTRYTGYQPARPAWLVIESTNHCNQRCPICPASERPGSRPRGFMDWDLFLGLVEEAARLRPERVALHAHGEPLMHPRIVDMVRALSERGLSAEIVTNGELLTPELSRALLDAGLDSLVVSHPAVSPEVYQTCRGQPLPPDKEARLVESLRLWAGARGRASVRSLVPAGYRERADPAAPGRKGAARTPSPSFSRRWLSIPGVHSVTYHGYMPWPGHCREDLLTKLSSRPGRCEIGMRALVVLWDGAVTPCSFDHAGLLAIGRAPEQPLARLYNGAPLRRLRRTWYHEPAGWPAICRSCLIPRCAASMTVNTAEERTGPPVAERDGKPPSAQPPPDGRHA